MATQQQASVDWAQVAQEMAWKHEPNDKSGEAELGRWKALFTPVATHMASREFPGIHAERLQEDRELADRINTWCIDNANALILELGDRWLDLVDNVSALHVMHVLSSCPGVAAEAFKRVDGYRTLRVVDSLQMLFRSGFELGYKASLYELEARAPVKRPDAWHPGDDFWRELRKVEDERYELLFGKKEGVQTDDRDL